MEKDSADALRLIERVSSSTGKSLEEVKALVEGKKAKFSGLLSEAGAAIIVARELGIESGLGKGFAETMKVSQLEDGMHAVDLTARVMQVFAPKKFEKGKKKGVLCSLVVADETGEIRLTLWHQDVKRLEELKIERGDALHLSNCFVSSFQEKKQLNFSYNSEMKIAEKSEGLPNLIVAKPKLAELSAGMNNVDVYARIGRIFEVKEFESKGRKGGLLGFEAFDETGRVRAVAWNELVDEVKKLKENYFVKIEGAYTKESLNGAAELHLGWQSRVLLNPKNHSMPELSAMKAKEFGEKALNAFAENDRAMVKAKISEVFNSRLFFISCPKCKKRVEAIGETFLCDNCGEVKEPLVKALASLELSDGTDSIRCVLFGEEAEKVLGFKAKELKEKSEKEDLEMLFDSFRDKLLGKEIMLQAKAKKAFEGVGLELIAEKVLEVK
ncbi:MAG: hypothetical protein V1494_03440 [Candidatus Diapherotrites archaeon]